MSLSIQHLSITEFFEDKTNVPNLDDGGVHVWHSQVDISTTQFALCSQVLSEDETARAGRYHFEKDQRQFTIARGLLRQLIGNYLEIEPTAVALKFEEFGKPYLEAQPLHFNVAHSGDHILIVFSKAHEVGIDIEIQMLHQLRILEIATTICTANELAFIQPLDEIGAETALTRLWTAKEAYLKALGTGLQIAPKTIEIERSVLTGNATSARLGDHEIYPFPQFEGQFGCSAALAVPV